MACEPAFDTVLMLWLAAHLQSSGVFWGIIFVCHKAVTASPTICLIWSVNNERSFLFNSFTLRSAISELVKSG